MGCLGYTGDPPVPVGHSRPERKTTSCFQANQPLMSQPWVMAVRNKLLSTGVISIIKGIVSMSKQMKNDPPGGKRQGHLFAGAPARQQAGVPGLDVAPAPSDQK